MVKWFVLQRGRHRTVSRQCDAHRETGKAEYPAVILNALPSGLAMACTISVTYYSFEVKFAEKDKSYLYLMQFFLEHTKFLPVSTQSLFIALNRRSSRATYMLSLSLTAGAQCAPAGAVTLFDAISPDWLRCVRAPADHPIAAWFRVKRSAVPSGHPPCFIAGGARHRWCALH